MPDRGDARAERIGQAGIVHEIGEGDDETDGDDGDPCLLDRPRDAWKKPSTPMPDHDAVMIAATRIAVPVASGWKPQTAA